MTLANIDLGFSDYFAISLVVLIIIGIYFFFGLASTLIIDFTVNRSQGKVLRTTPQDPHPETREQSWNNAIFEKKNELRKFGNAFVSEEDDIPFTIGWRELR